MSKTGYFFATSVVVLCTFCRGGDAAQNAPAVMSKYGEIQSVNKYSSNPFWTPTSPYNQRMPTPIYATGADLNTGDCNRVVQNLVTEYCTNHNNCSGTQLTDARPVIMVQLSQLPGHNFATSCGGYIDSIFEDYKKTYGNTSTNNIVKPTQQQKTAIQIENPFTQKKSAYETGVAERTAELEQLQSVTTPTPTVNPTDFPKTVADLSFTDRVANTTAGYEPYKDLSAYKTPQFETEQEYYERMKSVLEHDIRYIGATAPGCPAKYLTGRGATVSCAPILTNGTCDDVWCTDAAKINCATEHKISSNDRDDKTFYAKCTCNPGYEPDGNKCVKPNAQTPENGNDGGTPGGGSGGGSDGGGNGGGSGGDSTTTESGPQCLINIANDANFKSKIASDLSGVNDLTIWVNNNKSSFYSFIADYIIKYCLKGSSNDITEFNALLDSSNNIPVYIDFNGSKTSIGIDKTELFDYANYWTYPIVINNDSIKNIGVTLPKSMASLPNYVQKCTGSFFTSKAGGIIGGLRSYTIEKAARVAYPKLKGNGFVIGKVHFPGQLYNFHQTFFSWIVIGTKNYAIAREQIKKFADGINSDGHCSGNNMVVYLVSEILPDANKPETVKIISEPFFIR